MTGMGDDPPLESFLATLRRSRLLDVTDLDRSVGRLRPASARAAFEGVDPQLENAARVLGLGEAALFFRVTLPMAWRGILAGVLLAFARALGEFGATLMVAGSIPGKTRTLSIAVYEAVQAGQDDTANFLVAVTSITCIAVLLSAGRLAPGRVGPRF